MRLMIVMCKKIKTISFIAGIVSISVCAFSQMSFAQERQIDALYLDLDKKYRAPESWSALPFELEDPYKRVKNGPILTNVINKAKVEWISRWIANPKKVVPNAKMPNLGLNFDEIKAVIAYLASIAEKDAPKVEWASYLLKKEDDLSDEEYEEMDKIYNNGKGVWGRARCTICHPVKGLGGNVGVGPDLGEIVTKVNRNWLYGWIGDTKKHFPDTMMPQYRLTDSDLRGIVEYIMRDTQFVPEEKEEGDDKAAEGAKSQGPDVQVLSESEFRKISNNSELIESGRNVIEKARCFVCHNIKGFSELMPVVEHKRDSLEGFEKVLYEIRCLTCHRVQSAGGTYAPNLTMVGSKIKMEWENNFLQAPDIIRPLSQQMPKFNLTEDDAKFATGFMEKYLTNKALQPTEYDKEQPSPEIVSAGEKMFYEKGCNVCHAEGSKVGGVVGPHLGTVGDRLQSAYMVYHLRNPQEANPRAVEPNLALTDEEIKVLVGFLVDHVKKKEGKE